MDLTVNQWLAGFDSQMRSKEVLVWYVVELGYQTALDGPLNRPAYIMSGSCWKYTKVIVGSSPTISE